MLIYSWRGYVRGKGKGGHDVNVLTGERKEEERRESLTP